jgi:hypothetical protein
MHPQDRLLIAEALVRFAGDPRDLDAREERAWELAEVITTDEGLAFTEFVFQIDDDWREAVESE